MHILITTPSFPPFIGGGERYASTLARQLVARGQTVTVLTSAALQESDFWQGCGQDVEVEKAEPGLTIIRTPIRPMPGGFRSLLAWRKCMVLLSAIPGTLAALQTMAERVPAMTQLERAFAYIDGPVDVVHGFNISWEQAMMAGWRYARQKELPLVVTPYAHLGTGPRDRVALNSTMRHQLHILSTADLLFTLTSAEARGLQARGVKQNKVKVAGPGVDIPETVLALPETGAALKPYVLFIGRTSYDKGAFHAVHAVLRLRERGSDIQLVVIGRETDEFRRFYNGLPVSDQRFVHILGLVEENLKHAYLRDAEALLLPSRTDSFGIVLLESWLHSRPVVAAAAGGIPAVVDNGKNGILVSFGDTPSLANAIRLLTEDQELNRILGDNGLQKLLTHYTWESVTEKVLDAYQEAIDAYRPEMTGS